MTSAINDMARLHMSATHNSPRGFKAPRYYLINANFSPYYGGVPVLGLAEVDESQEMLCTQSN